MNRENLIYVLLLVLIYSCSTNESETDEKSSQTITREWEEDVVVSIEDSPSEEATIVPNELIVEYTSDVTQSQKDSIHAQYGVIESQNCSCGNSKFAKWIFEDDGVINPTKEAIRNNSGVGVTGQVVNNYTFGIPSNVGVVPSHVPLFSLMNSTPNKDYVKHLAGSTGQVIVAIMDSGIDTYYQSLSDLLLYETSPYGLCKNELSGWDFVQSDANPQDQFSPSHGLVVSYIIHTKLTQNDVPHLLLPIKVADSNGNATLFNILCGLQYAKDRKVDVLNMSLGWSLNDPYVDKMFLSIAKSFKGIIVASAGNDSSNNDSNPFYPSSYNLDNLVSVAAARGNANTPYNITSYSNYGVNSVDFYALGKQNFPLDPYQNYIYQIDAKGTSFAAPVVSAAIAEMLTQGYNVNDLNTLLQYMKIAYGIDASNFTHQVKYKSIIDY